MENQLKNQDNSIRCSDRKAVSGRQESGDRSQKSGDRRQETEGRSQKSGDRRQESEVRRQKMAEVPEATMRYPDTSGASVFFSPPFLKEGLGGGLAVFSEPKENCPINRPKFSAELSRIAPCSVGNVSCVSDPDRKTTEPVRMEKSIRSGCGGKRAKARKRRVRFCTGFLGTFCP